MRGESAGGGLAKISARLMCTQEGIRSSSFLQKWRQNKGRTESICGGKAGSRAKKDCKKCTEKGGNLHFSKKKTERTDPLAEEQEPKRGVAWQALPQDTLNVSGK